MRTLIHRIVFTSIVATMFFATAGNRAWALPQDTPAAIADSGANPIGGESSDSNIIASKRLIEVIRNGGPLMVPIGICSFILLVFVFERAISLRKSRIIPRPFVKRFLQQLRDGALDRTKALEL